MLTHQTLGLLDSGNAGERIDQAIRIITDDHDARGDDEKARKVVITVTIQRVDGVDSIKLEAVPKIPALGTKPQGVSIVIQDGQPMLDFESGSNAFSLEGSDCDSVISVP